MWHVTGTGNILRKRVNIQEKLRIRNFSCIQVDLLDTISRIVGAFGTKLTEKAASQK